MYGTQHYTMQAYHVIKPQTKSTLFKIMFHIGIQCLSHGNAINHGQTSVSSSLIKRAFPELSIRTIQRHLKTLKNDNVFEFRTLKKSTDDVSETIKNFYENTLEKRRSYNIHSQHTGLLHVRMNDEQLKNWIKLVNALDQEDECSFNFIAKLSTGKDWNDIKNDNHVRFQLGIRHLASEERYNILTKHRKYFSPNAIRYIENGIIGWRGLHNKTQIATLRYAIRCNNEGREYSWKTAEILTHIKKRVDRMTESGNITMNGLTVLKLYEKFSKTDICSKILKTSINKKDETHLICVFCSDVAIYNNKEVRIIKHRNTFPAEKEKSKTTIRWKELYERGKGFDNKKQYRKREMPAWVKEKIDRRKRGEEGPPKIIPEQTEYTPGQDDVITKEEVQQEEFVKCNVLAGILGKKTLNRDIVRDTDQNIGIRKFAIYKEATR